MVLKQKAIEIMLQVLGKYYSKHGPWQLIRPGTGEVLIISNSSSRYIFKRHMDLTRPNRSALEKIYNICGQKELTPRLIPSDAGELLLEVTEGMFSVQKFIDGKTALSKDENLLVEGLAKLHESLSFVQTREIRNHLDMTVSNIKESAIKYGYQDYLPTLESALELMARNRQLIHCDLHPGNILVSEGKAWVLDLDTATHGIRAQDVAFLAYRIFGDNPDKISNFFQVYKHQVRDFPDYSLDDISCLMIYTVLQRILFILIRKDMGDDCWLIDLENQKRYLEECYRLQRSQTQRNQTPRCPNNN